MINFFFIQVDFKKKKAQSALPKGSSKKPPKNSNKSQTETSQESKTVGVGDKLPTDQPDVASTGRVSDGERRVISIEDRWEQKRCEKLELLRKFLTKYSETLQ